jgi:predicted nucleotidyltransferase
MIQLEETVRVLYDAGVEFAVIGGAAMGLQGSAHLTKDIDFCYCRTSRNFERLARAIAPLHPRLRNAPSDLPFRFDAQTIAAGMNFTLTTDLGDLDFLGEVSGLGFYKEVLAQSDKRSIGGLDCYVLSLEGLIKAKEAAGRPRDLYVLPELRGLAELKKKTGLE